MATKVLNECTFAKTGNQHQEQFYAQCLDCFPTGNEGACVTCLQICHNGHRIGQTKKGLFFCDCAGRHFCQMIKSTFPCSMEVEGEAINMTKSPNMPNSPNMTKSSNTLAGKLFKVMEPQTLMPPGGYPRYAELPKRLFSPLSITYALSLVHLGTMAETEKQLTDLFNCKHTMDEMKQCFDMFNNASMTMATAFIFNDWWKINPQYTEMLKEVALVSSENFADKSGVAERVNQFISKTTNGLIKEMISAQDINPNVIAFLVNSIYFKANWLHKFPKQSTRKCNFSNFEGEVEVDMMFQCRTMPYYENESMQLVELPYVGNEYCMGFVLLKSPKLFFQFNMESMKNVIDQLSNDDKVELFIPKFTQRRNIDLIPHLKKLGVNDLFDENKANLEGICKEAYVAKVVHEALVIVDEEGVEAAASTVITMVNRSIMDPKSNKVFRADHSFHYYIRHMPTNTILFLGDYNGK